MPKSYSVQSVVNFNPLQFVMDGTVVVGFLCSVELNMGSFGMTQQIDIWEWMPANMKNSLQSFHDRLKVKLYKHYMGD
ncbi:hypothetical protein ES703_28417 [subsurface metagenome]